jgi:hypothetical protein
MRRHHVRRAGHVPSTIRPLLRKAGRRRLVGKGKDAPTTGDSWEVVVTSVMELEVGAGDEIGDGPSHEDLTGAASADTR